MMILFISNSINNNNYNYNDSNNYDDDDNNNNNINSNYSSSGVRFIKNWILLFLYIWYFWYSNPGYGFKKLM
jgi:hypothetical protein